MPHSERPGLRRRALRLAGGFALAAMLAGPAAAAELAGVTFPPRAEVNRTTLTLNGIGLRTYSILDVHIYVAGLYLEAPSQNADAILDSPGTKMLLLYFVHAVPADKVRDAWSKGLLSNCTDPCTLPSAELSRFLASLPAMQAGETVELVFSPTGMRAYFNGTFGGEVADPQFARLMLAMFLGPHTNSPSLKEALLDRTG